jgi:hypothetical protein
LGGEGDESSGGEADSEGTDADEVEEEGDEDEEEEVEGSYVDIDDRNAVFFLFLLPMPPLLLTLPLLTSILFTSLRSTRGIPMPISTIPSFSPPPLTPSAFLVVLCVGTACRNSERACVRGSRSKTTTVGGDGKEKQKKNMEQNKTKRKKKKTCEKFEGEEDKPASGAEKEERIVEKDSSSLSTLLGTGVTKCSDVGSDADADPKAEADTPGDVLEDGAANEDREKGDVKEGGVKDDSDEGATVPNVVTTPPSLRRPGVRIDLDMADTAAPCAELAVLVTLRRDRLLLQVRRP